MSGRNLASLVSAVLLVFAVAVPMSACKKDSKKSACKKFCNRLPEEMPKDNIKMFFNGIEGCINHCEKSPAKKELAKKCASASSVVDCYSKEKKGRPLWYKDW